MAQAIAYYVYESCVRYRDNRDLRLSQEFSSLVLESTIEVLTIAHRIVPRVADHPPTTSQD
jgi:hypothetical protein